MNAGKIELIYWEIVTGELHVVAKLCVAGMDVEIEFIRKGERDFLTHGEQLAVVQLLQNGKLMLRHTSGNIYRVEGVRT